jgi:hypothetical protein
MDAILLLFLVNIFDMGKEDAYLPQEWSWARVDPEKCG